METYLQANRKWWDQLTQEHEKSAFYDLNGFKAGKDRLRSIGLNEMGDVTGKSLLHLQCHFGMEPLLGLVVAQLLLVLNSPKTQSL